jgi:putative resolvase
MTGPPDLVTPADAARILGVSVATLRTYERAGKLTCIRTPGNQRRYHRAELTAITGATA